MKVLSLILYIALFCHQNNGFDIGIVNFIQSGVDLFKSITQNAPHSILTPKQMAELPKNVLFGLPATVMSSFINSICFSALDVISPRVTPDIKKMMLQLRTACDVEYFPLLSAEQIMRSSNFKHDKQVVVIVSGWFSRPDSDCVLDLAKAFICRNDTNVLILDNADYIRTLYTWAAFNTEEIGKNLAKSLVKLSKVIPAKNIHLVGHSLGAQIVGAAGRYFIELSGQKLSRITGLDPAKPCFNHGGKLPGIFRGNADYVDILHTNPGVFGQSQLVGDLDFYPGGLLPIKPGCLILGNFCSHERAWIYYAESVYPNNKKNFLGTRCTSMTKLRLNDCQKEQRVMGYAVSHRLKGIFVSEVNAKEPHGLNAQSDFQSSQSACGTCQNS